MVGQKNDGFLMFRVPDLDATQRKWTFPLALNTGQGNELVPLNVSVHRYGPFFDDFDVEVMAKTSDKVHPLRDPFRPEVIVDVGAIHRDNRATLHRQCMRCPDVGMRGGREMDKLRHVVVMIQKHVGLDAAFDFFELCPRKQRQAQRNSGGIQRQQFVLKTKWFLTWSPHGLAAKSSHYFPKQLLKQCSGPMLIRIREVGFAGSFRDSKVLQLTHTTTQAIAD